MNGKTAYANKKLWEVVGWILVLSAVIWGLAWLIHLIFFR